MMRFARDVKLIPLVLIATIGLFVLKVSGLVFDGGYTLAERMDHNRNDLKIVPPESVPDFPKIVIADGLDEQVRKRAWAKDMFNFSGANNDVTGAVDKEKKEEKKSEDKKSEDKKVEGEKKPEGEKKDDKVPGTDMTVSNKPPDPTKVEVGDVSVQIEPGHIASAGERAVLESLRERNQQLNARSRELDMRESLVKAAEKRLEAKVTELKDTESRVNSAIGTRDKAEAARFASIVSMYESMKPKDAARIFDRLDLGILVDVTTKINPRKMSDILAQMSPESAERLTVELANRAGGPPKAQAAGQLPKIEGKPLTP
jgi:flagellar motility protein MotE (MotC chaperone)